MIMREKMLGREEPSLKTVFWCVERTDSRMWWVGAAIPLKEEERHLFSVISGQVDRLNIGSEYGIYNMFSKESWWE